MEANFSSPTEGLQLKWYLVSAVIVSKLRTGHLWTYRQLKQEIKLVFTVS